MPLDPEAVFPVHLGGLVATMFGVDREHVYRAAARRVRRYRIIQHGPCPVLVSNIPGAVTCGYEDVITLSCDYDGVITTR